MKHPDDVDGTRDWRGTPIVPGAPCIYGAPVGRSIALVEGEVVGFTKSGRVNVRVIRRAYGGGWSEREIVHVGHDRLIIIQPDTLPPTTLPTEREAIAQHREQMAERERNEASHTGMTYGPLDEGQDAYIRGRWGWTPCTVCGTTDPRAKECGAP